MPFCLISLILADSGHAPGAACRQKVSLHGGVSASSVTNTFTYTILITFVILITIFTTNATTGVLLHHRNNVLAHSLL